MVTVDVVVESGGTESRGVAQQSKPVVAELERIIADLSRENALLKHHLELLRRRIFGRSSEKGTVTVAEQQALPFGPTAAGVVDPEASDEAPAEEERAETTTARRRHPGRRALEKEIPRRRFELLPPASEMSCGGCGEHKQPIGEDVTEELDFQPSSFFINEFVRPKFACPSCKEGVVQSILPARPIEKGRPGAGLLAQVVTSKYADHLPLYRQEQIFARHGIEVSRRTMSEWNGAVADLLKPIVGVMLREQVLRSAWIQCDDTGIEVQQYKQVPGIREGHMWVYRGEGSESVYDFTWSRNRDGPMRMLAAYRGYLQADAAPAFDDVFVCYPDILEVGCWAHARRYFKEAAPTAALECAQVLAWVRELYAIEKSATEKKLDASARRELRQRHSRAILGKLQSYLDEQALVVLPKSPLAKAVSYARNHWTALTRYIENGRLKIDNNGAEQALRPIVLGRKNWLFAGSEAAAHRAAILCSLVQTCKNLGIDPFIYLRDVIERVSVHPAKRILELTPREWKRLRDQPRAQAAA